MNVERTIQEICCCLEALFCEDCNDKSNQQFKDDKDAINYNLKIKIHSALEKVESYSEIRRNVIDSIQACCVEKCSCDHLTFLQMCLILLKLLQKTLSQEIDSPLMSSTQRDSEKIKLLSVSQQNVLKKCFQFIVGLGILPNLMRGVAIPLSSKLQHANIFENFSNDSTCYQKHAQLVLSLETLLDCLEYEAMISTLLNYYGTYMLAALLQLCHASIKRVEKKEIAAVTVSSSDKIEFHTMLAAIKDNSDHNECEIVSLMFLHRSHFNKCLRIFLSKMSSSLVMWELILFLGIPVQSDYFQKKKLARYPNWMRKICHEKLMHLLSQNHGIVSLIQAVLDKAFDADVENGKVDGKQMEAVALLITHLVQDDNLESYVQKLSKQVFQLLHLKESQVNSPLKFTASCMVLQFYERNQTLGENYFLNKILDPLQKCVNLHDDEKAIIVDENELTKCIEDLHQIFTSAALPLKKKSIDILFPFFHCLTSLYFFLFKGTLFLKCKVKDLLIEILSAASSSDALHLLSVGIIPSYINKDVLTPTVCFAYGDEGGVIAAAKKSPGNTDKAFCCNALLDLIGELHNKELNSAFILQIMKEYCNFHLRAKEYPLDINLKTQSDFSTLLQEMSECNVDVGEALASNISEVIKLIMALLDNISNYDFDASFRDETTMVVLVILSSLLTCENHVLSANDWQCIKKCLPSLQKLQKCGIDSNLKEMLMSVTIHIATQGVCSVDEEDSATEILNNCSVMNHQILESNLESRNTCDSLSKNIIGNTLTDSSEEVKTALNMLEELDSQNECHLKECTDKPKTQTHNLKEHLKSYSKRALNDGSVTKSKALNVSKCSDYEKAFEEANDKDIPIQGNGLINLGKLIQKRDKEAVINKAKIFQLFQEGIKHEDSYIYLSAIQGISYLADLDTEMVLPTVLKIFQDTEENCDVIVNVGEVLLKICRLLGDMIYKYRDQLLHAYLIGSKNPHPKIRTSSLSNLGEVCMYLKFDISNCLQEILECVLSLLKTDKDLEVRRCSVMVISLLLKGMGKEMLKILPSDIHKIYRQLKFVRDTERDEVLCLHSDLAIQEIDSNMKDLLNPSALLTKEIKILP